jgi:hypothetical protein
LFHAGHEEALFVLTSMDMVALHVRPLPPQRSRSPGQAIVSQSYQAVGPCSLNSRCQAESSRWRYGKAAPGATVPKAGCEPIGSRPLAPLQDWSHRPAV